ncbi:MAG: tetratricopeptide repeat protein [Cyanobacteria bacterium P01_A01_bin.84]
MSKSRNRWMVNFILVIAALAFLGVSMFPLIAAFNSREPSNSETASNQIASNNNTTPSPAQEISRLQKNLQFYERLSQEEPDNEIALRNLVLTRLELIKLKQGDIKTAIQDLEKLVKLAPETLQYAVLLGQTKQQIGDSEGAAQTFRSALKVNPGNTNLIQAMVNLQLQQKRPKAAISLLQDTLSAANKPNNIQPSNVDINALQTLLGNVYASEKRYGEAIAAYDKAIKNDKKDFRPVLAKAMLLKEQGKTDEAKPLFDTASSLAPAQSKDEIERLRQPTRAPTSSPEASATPKK